MTRPGPAVSVFLPSHNKPEYVADAVASVLAQDCPDFELWVLENSTDRVTRAVLAPLVRDRRVIYEEITFGESERMPWAWPPAILMNRYYPKAAGQFIAYISDDDVWEPRLLSRCVAEFDARPDYHAVWFTMWRSVWSADLGRFKPAGSIPAVCEVGAGCAQERADCRVDGGQVIHRRECLDEIPPPWFPESGSRQVANHNDGVFLQKLADLHPLHPVPDKLMTHRATPLSWWDTAG